VGIAEKVYKVSGQRVIV